MAIIRRTCTVCGLVTRCEDTDPNYCACVHKEGPFEEVNEDDEHNKPPVSNEGQ